MSVVCHWPLLMLLPSMLLVVVVVFVVVIAVISAFLPNGIRLVVVGGVVVDCGGVVRRDYLRVVAQARRNRMASYPCLWVCYDTTYIPGTRYQFMVPLYQVFNTPALLLNYVRTVNAFRGLSL